jgi:hypothetical protein
MTTRAVRAAGVVSVTAYVPHAAPPPGALALVPLDVEEVLPDGLRVPGVTVVDVRGGVGLDTNGRLRSDPADGGGRLSDPNGDAAARAFALTNAAGAARRLLQWVETSLGVLLPHLPLLVGCHQAGRLPWGGGHYRLPAASYSELPEDSDVSPTGEVHLGAGRTYLRHAGVRYLHAPAHNVALVTHEVAHHVCRHVADFRLNRLRPPFDQSNRKTAVEEGTCDYLAGALIGHPDIYGWHRGHLPVTDPRRRYLAAPWTMADFRGGHDNDPHADGSIWACALWAARSGAACAGCPPGAVDELVLRGLDRLRGQHDDRGEETRRVRQYFGTLLAAMLEAGTDPVLADHVERVMAERGIRPGWSNARARDEARGWR